jgi:excisionase family DNA binding protein
VKNRNLPPIDANQRYEIPEAAEYLRVCRARVYQHVATGKLRLIKDGRRAYVSGADLIAASRPVAA